MSVKTIMPMSRALQEGIVAADAAESRLLEQMGQALVAKTLPLFEDVLADVRGMVHDDDPHTSVDAAAVLQPKLRELHAKVLDAFARFGNMTDEDLEDLDEFADYGPSTIRKRRSELFQMKALVWVGERRNSRGRKMIVWGLP